jgi:mannose-6-phosphate isomerase-like protein (cupin superfamily)
MNTAYNQMERDMTVTARHVVGATEGRYVHFRALGTRYIVTGEQTGGTLAVVEHDLTPRSLGAPMHTHEREDEVSHVLSGRLGVQIGDEVLEAGPGETVFKPRGVAHAFWNPGDEPVRFVEMITPAGFEHYFADLEPHLTTGAPPDLEAMGAVMARYALAMDMDSMPRLIAEHGLEVPAI